MDDDLVYLLRRANRERAMAARADHEGARTAHLDLAEAYAARLDRETASEPVAATRIEGGGALRCA